MKRLAMAISFGALFFAPAASAATPIRVMLLDGESAGPHHAWRSTTPVLKKELEDAGLFQVEVVTAPQSTQGLANFQPDFEKYKVVVFNYDAPDWPPALRKSFEQYLQQGGGFVAVHAADNAFPNWAAYNEMTGVGGWRNRTQTAGPHWFFDGAKMVSDPAPGSAGSHGARLPFQVVTRAAEHPIMKGLPAVWMHQGDELYASLRGPGKSMTVLATAHSDPANNGTGHEEPILIAVRYGKGRIFHTTLGHDVSALTCAGFIATFQRGTEWAATGKVTQKTPADFPGPDQVSVRADIAVMAAH